MNAKEFEKAQKAMTRIKEIDTEIIQIQRFADKIEIDGAKVQFDLSVNIPVKEPEKSVCDDDDSPYDAISRMYFPVSFLRGGHTNSEPSKSKTQKADVISGRELSDVSTFRILKIILDERIRIRETHIATLQKLGVKIA